MKLAEARRIIEEGKQIELSSQGYMVHYEIKEGSMYTSGYFPDKRQGETVFEAEETAWEWAEEFAKYAPPQYVNIYVVHGDFVPVDSYKERELRS